MKTKKLKLKYEEDMFKLDFISGLKFIFNYDDTYKLNIFKHEILFTIYHNELSDINIKVIDIINDNENYKLAFNFFDTYSDYSLYHYTLSKLQRAKLNIEPIIIR